jgi:hypothetical protein
LTASFATKTVCSALTRLLHGQVLSMQQSHGERSRQLTMASNTGFKIGFFVLLLLRFSLSASSQPAQTEPEDLIRRVIQNELKAEDQDDSHWMFRLETEKRRMVT